VEKPTKTLNTKFAQSREIVLKLSCKKCVHLSRKGMVAEQLFRET